MKQATHGISFPPLNGEVVGLCYTCWTSDTGCQRLSEALYNCTVIFEAVLAFSKHPMKCLCQCRWGSTWPLTSLPVCVVHMLPLFLRHLLLPNFKLFYSVCKWWTNLPATSSMVSLYLFYKLPYVALITQLYAPPRLSDLCYSWCILFC